MSYRRVIPRDLFNEANLLKCLGALWIALDSLGDHTAVIHEPDGPFDVQQDAGSGAIMVANLPFTVDRRLYYLTRPLNSRQPWPLYAESDEGDCVSVFDDDGALSDDFRALIAPRL
jgi:hypothetical protein